MHVCSYVYVHVYACEHAFVCVHYTVFLYSYIFTVEVNKMAEGPDPANRSSQDKSSRQEEQEPVVVEPDVTCGHCKRELNNPYLLCCLHSVCRECLPNMVVENDHLKCPKCGDTSTHCNNRKVLESECRVESLRCVPVPNGPLARYIEGMKIVQKVTQNVPILCGNKRCKSGDSPSTVFCTDCWKFLCERCHDVHEIAESYEDHTVKTLEEIHTLFAQDRQTLSPKSTAPSTCPQHNGKVLEYCCEQCDVLMCQACTVDRKSSHVPVFLDASVSHRHTQSVKIARQTAVCYERKYQKIEKEFQTQIRTMDEMKEAALHDINTAFQNIHQAVDERKEELCRLVIATAEEKKRTISSKLTAAKRETEMSASTQSSLQFLLTSGSSHDVIASKDLVQTQQSVLTSKWCQEEFESTVSQVVTFDPTNQDVLLKAIREFGVVEDGACPVNCTVDPKPETVRWNGSDPLKLTLNTFDSKNIRCKQGGDNVEAFLCPKSPIPCPAIKARVVDDENGQYTLSFPITYTGECDLSILVNGSDVRGSPFGVDFLPKPKPGELNKNVAELGANKGYLNFSQQPAAGYPWGIAVAPNGHTFIADHISHQIHVFDEQRKHIRSFGQRGSGNGQLQGPIGVAVDAKGLVYASNFNNNRIEVLQEDGTFVRHFGVGHIARPWGVAVNKKLVYVAERSNNRIAIFTLEGQLIRTIGSQGSGPGQLNYPSAVAFSPDGDMYVADQNNHRIQVFNSDGVYQREFGGGQVKYPYDILITADGHVLVADTGNKCVVIFNTTGQLIHSFQVPSGPHGLAIDHNGDLLVTLPNTKQVAVF